MLITPAYAQAAAGGDANSMLMSLLPFALIFVIMYFLILRPQQKKVKDHQELVKNIRRGDTVVTSGGPGRQGHQGGRRRPDRVRDFGRRRVRQMRQMISGVAPRASRPRKRLRPRTRRPRAEFAAPPSAAHFPGSDGSTRCCISRGGRRWRSF
jgi:preprotein translocase subunit YajC